MTESGQPGSGHLPTLGEELRKERELRGISLKEIADSTKISKRFLEAIERDDIGALPAAVFTRGFVREYARYLGLNAEEMVSRYAQELKEHEQATQAREAAQINAWSAAATARHPSLPETSPVERKHLPLLSVVIGAVIVSAVAYAIFSFSRKPAANAAPAATALPEPESMPPPPAAGQPPEREGLLLQLRVSENSWITLLVDGEQVFSGEMRAGDEKSYEARENVVFKTIGNAGGVEITLNGMKVPPLGESGEVVKNRKFDRASLDTLTQTRTE